MSTQSIREIMGRAISDPAYRELLFARPAEALAGFELTEEESTLLRGLKRDQFDVLAGELEARVSKSSLGTVLPLAIDRHPSPPEFTVDVQKLVEALGGTGTTNEGDGEITPINLP